MSRAHKLLIKVSSLFFVCIAVSAVADTNTLPVNQPSASSAAAIAPATNTFPTAAPVTTTAPAPATSAATTIAVPNNTTSITMPTAATNTGPAPAATSAAPQALPSILPPPPTLDAQAYVLLDANSGRIIAQLNMDQRRPPASLTKLMTLYITSRALESGLIHLDDPVRISQNAWQTGGSKMFVRVGDNVPVQQLVQGIIVDSGNDATVAMAEYIGGSTDTFVNMMNAQAQALGMANTHYMDPTGLPDPNHYSTAHDLAILARTIVVSFPQYYYWYSQKWFTYDNIKQSNRNRLLWLFPGADGMKTGHTDEAGYCLIASAQRNGTRLISVVLGTPSDQSRTNDSIALLTYGFRFFATHQLYQAGGTLANPRIWFGAENTVPVGLTNNVFVTLPNNQDQQVQMQLNLQPGLQAPIKKGQIVGNLTIIANDQPVSSQPVIALADVEKAGMFGYISDRISHLFDNNKTNLIVRNFTFPAVSIASATAQAVVPVNPSTVPQDTGNNE